MPTPTIHRCSYCHKWTTDRTDAMWQPSHTMPEVDAAEVIMDICPSHKAGHVPGTSHPTWLWRSETERRPVRVIKKNP